MGDGVGRGHRVARLPDHRLGDTGGHLSVNGTTPDSSGQTFTLTGIITRKSTITLGGTQYRPIDGRQYLKVCGTVKAPADDEGLFIQGVSNNLSTDTGIGFVFIDDSVTEWREVDPCSRLVVQRARATFGTCQTPPPPPFTQSTTFRKIWACTGWTCPPTRRMALTAEEKAAGRTTMVLWPKNGTNRVIPQKRTAPGWEST